MRGIGLRAALLPVLLVLLVGCGYHFPGGVGFPGGIRTVYLDARPGGTPLAQNLSDILRRSGETRLVKNREKADAVLRIDGGQITSRTAALNRQGVATEYEVRVSADYRLIRQTPSTAQQDGEEPGDGSAQQEPDGEGEGQDKDPVIRQASGLQISRTIPFDPATNPAAEEATQRRAGRQASEELARQILGSIRSGF